MFYGRKKELESLNDSYKYDGFQMVVVYGRRRVGKSYLLQHFFQSLDSKIIAFQAIENSVKLSIEAFKDAILDVFPSNFDIKLDSWKECFKYINENIDEQKIVICIDEINYIFKSDNTFSSQLQNEIDSFLKHKNILLIVCGSSISSIENEVLNANAPLYGRRTTSIKLNEFNYLEASDFYNNYSYEDKVIAYSVFGGKGKNLASIDSAKTVKENVIKQILTPGGALADEIDLLLKDDFRDTAFYKELLYTLSIGNTTFNDICSSLNEGSSKVATYLNKLIETRIVEKKLLDSKKKNDYRYYITDNFFSFYFRFVYKRNNILNILVTPETYYSRFIENDLLSYVGLKFENICEQFIINKSLNGELGFIPLVYGKYYGKHRDGSTFDIDVFFKDDETALCGECKFTSKKFNINDLDELMENAKEINVKNIEYYIFSKKGVDDKVLEKEVSIHIVNLNELFNLSHQKVPHIDMI